MQGLHYPQLILERLWFYPSMNATTSGALWLPKQIILNFIQISELVSMKQQKNSLQLPKPATKYSQNCSKHEI